MMIDRAQQATNLVPAALFAEVVALGSIAISPANVAAVLAAVMTTGGIIAAVIKWFKDMIAKDIAHHNTIISSKLALQDANAVASNERLLAMLAAQNAAAEAAKQLTEMSQKLLLTEIEHLRELMNSIPHTLERRKGV